MSSGAGAGQNNCATIYCGVRLRRVAATCAAALFIAAVGRWQGGCKRFAGSVWATIRRAMPVLHGNEGRVVLTGIGAALLLFIIFVTPRICSADDYALFRNNPCVGYARDTAQQLRAAKIPYNVVYGYARGGYKGRGPHVRIELPHGKGVYESGVLYNSLEAARKFDFCRMVIVPNGVIDGPEMPITVYRAGTRIYAEGKLYEVGK